MKFVLDTSVAVRWFVSQPGSDDAATWLRSFIDDPELFVGPDLLRFELHGALARLQPAHDSSWAPTCFSRFDRLGVRMLPTTLDLFRRALEVSRTMRIGGYDAIYLAHAEAIGAPWLTADARILRRLGKDKRVRPLASS
jgi:predicted nucleic acid-binding protein